MKIASNKMQCARCACSLGMWLTRPFHDDSWQRYSLMQGAIKVLSIYKSIFTSFIIHGWSTWWVRCAWTGPVNYPGQPAPLLILVRAKLHLTLTALGGGGALEAPLDKFCRTLKTAALSTVPLHDFFLWSLADILTPSLRKSNLPL